MVTGAVYPPPEPQEWQDEHANNAACDYGSIFFPQLKYSNRSYKYLELVKLEPPLLLVKCRGPPYTLLKCHWPLRWIIESGTFVQEWRSLSHLPLVTKAAYARTGQASGLETPLVQSLIIECTSSWRTLTHPYIIGVIFGKLDSNWVWSFKTGSPSLLLLLLLCTAFLQRSSYMTADHQ